MKPGGDPVPRSARPGLVSASPRSTRVAAYNAAETRRLFYQRLLELWRLFMADEAIYGSVDTLRNPWAAAVGRTVSFFQREAGFQAADLRTMSRWEAGYPDPPTYNPVRVGGLHNEPRAVATAHLSGPITYKQRIDAGWTPQEAERSAVASVITAAETQVAQAYDATLLIGLLTDPEVVAWRRVITEPACDRCIVLAGKLYRADTVTFTLPGEKRDERDHVLEGLMSAEIESLFKQGDNSVTAWGFRRHPRCDCLAEPVWLPPGKTAYDANRRGPTVINSDEAWARAQDFTRYNALRREARYWNVLLPFDLAEARRNPALLDEWRATLRWYQDRGRLDARTLTPVIPPSVA